MTDTTSSKSQIAETISAEEAAQKPVGAAASAPKEPFTAKVTPSTGGGDGGTPTNPLLSSGSGGIDHSGVGGEIASLDFDNLIGGPLNAIINAQAKAALTTAEFIKEVGFTLPKQGDGQEGQNDERNQLVKTEFHYSRKNDTGGLEEYTLEVPLLTMLPIPYIKVESGTIEFNAKITSVQTARQATSLTNDTDLDIDAGWYHKVKFKTTTAFQKESESTGKVNRHFDMRVKVDVKNAEMPAGTERLLSILENCIEERPAGPRIIGRIKSSTPTQVPETGDATSWNYTVGLTIEEGEGTDVKEGMWITINNVTYAITGVTPADADTPVKVNFVRASPDQDPLIQADQSFSIRKSR